MNLSDQTPVRVKLKCDPAPDPEKAVFLVRPLTYLEMAEARLAAGPQPWNGRRLADKVAHAQLRGFLEAAQALRPEDDREYGEIWKTLTGVERGLVGLAGEEAQTAAFCTLTPEDLLEVDWAEAWTLRVSVEMCARAVVSVDGQEVGDFRAFLERLRPVSLYRDVAAELESKILEVSSLSPEGKAEYGARFGLSATPTAAAGTAQSAPGKRPFCELEDGAVGEY